MRNTTGWRFEGGRIRVRLINMRRGENTLFSNPFNLHGGA